METQAITCRVVVNGVECGRKELLAKKKHHVVYDRIYGQMTHHECALHKLHLTLTGEHWKVCDCLE